MEDMLFDVPSDYSIIRKNFGYDKQVQHGSFRIRLSSLVRDIFTL